MPASSARVPWLKITGWLVVSRLLILLIGQLALLGVAKGPHFHGPKTLLDSFLCWDVGWYSLIAQNGYTYDPAAQSSVAFFPLYPILMKAVEWVVRNYLVAGVLVSNASLLLACGLLWRMAREMAEDNTVANNSVMLLLLNPVTFFFSDIYSESLFLVAAIGAMWLALHGRWWLAGLCGALAALTRSVGVLLVLPLAWEWLLQRRYRSGGSMVRRTGELAACGLPLLGTLAYFGYLHFRFGDFFGYFHAQRFWFQALATPMLTFYNTYYNLPPFYGWWYTFALAAAVATLAAGFCFRLRSSHLVFAITFMALYVCKNHLDSLPRYLAVIYPFYLAEALALRRWPATAPWIWSLNGACLALSTILFVTGFYFP